MTGSLLKLVAAIGTAKPNIMAAILGERIGLHRFAGPRTRFIDAVVDFENSHCAILSLARADLQGKTVLGTAILACFGFAR